MRSGKSAFTLIEITVALVILIVGIIGILTLFPIGFDAVGRARHVMTATFFAQEKMEELKRDGYDIALSKNGESGDIGDNYEYEIVALDGIPDGGGGRRLVGILCEVIVTVYWPKDIVKEKQRNIVTKTYLAKYEP